MIQAQAYDPVLALDIFRRLDPNDWTEANAVRGYARAASHLDLFAEWHGQVPHHVLSLILRETRHGQAFAVLALGNTGQSGVAQAALLARSHKTFRRALVSTARLIRSEMPKLCEEQGIFRIEARSWAGHPTANRFLAACGFQLEATMPGFGRGGCFVFNQFAWVSPGTTEGNEPCA